MRSRRVVQAESCAKSLLGTSSGGLFITLDESRYIHV